MLIYTYLKPEKPEKYLYTPVYFQFFHLRIWVQSVSKNRWLCRLLTKELARVHSVKPETIRTDDAVLKRESILLDVEPRLFTALDGFLRILPESFDENEKQSKYKLYVVCISSVSSLDWPRCVWLLYDLTALSFDSLNFDSLSDRFDCVKLWLL